MSNLSWLNPTPRAIAVYASQPLSPVATQHSLPSRTLPFTWARVGSDEQRVYALLLQGHKRCIDFTIGAGIDDFDLTPHGRCYRLHFLAHCLGDDRIFWINKHGEACGIRKQLVQKTEPLRGNIYIHKSDTSNVAARSIQAGDEASLDRIASSAENDRNRHGRSLGRHR